MSTGNKQSFSVASFRALPAVELVLELFGGRVIPKISPKLRHSAIQTRLSSRLLVVIEPAQIGIPFVELRCTFGGASHVFDLSLFPWNRCLNLASVDDCIEVTTPPDLAVEILSPGQTVGELARKRGSAIRRGVRLGWLIDDRKRQVHVLRPGIETQILREGDVLDGGEVLPGFALPLAELFGWLANT